MEITFVRLTPKIGFVKICGVAATKEEAIEKAKAAGSTIVYYKKCGRYTDYSIADKE